MQGRKGEMGIVDDLYLTVKPTKRSRPKESWKPSPGNCIYTSVRNKALTRSDVFILVIKFVCLPLEGEQA